ncbi:MAG: hypothetical protein U0263_27080 [Polyangiaceae bacterium]
MPCWPATRSPTPSFRFGVALAATCLACTSSPPPQPTSEPSAPRAPASAAPSVATEPSTAASAGAPEPSARCGELDCRTFDDPRKAFEVVLDKKPLVLGIGEAHAQKGSEAIDSTTKRFTGLLLPVLQGKASFLAVELMMPNPKCQKETKQVAKQQKPVTEPQAETNQNEYVVLGKKAKELGIVPDLLRPSCEDLTRITQAGAGDIGVMLETIAKLTREVAKTELDRNKKAGKELTVVAYGGALHNDASPRAGRETWSYGPELAKATGDRYVELDLIVPEFIKDTESWTSLPWYAHYDKAKLGAKTVLFHPSPSSYVLIFPVTTVTE